jgi:hypothetical protein
MAYIIDLTTYEIDLTMDDIDEDRVVPKEEPPQEEPPKEEPPKEEPPKEALADRLTRARSREMEQDNRPTTRPRY